MKTMLTVPAIVLAFSGSAFAQSPSGSCSTQASGKKLAGAAMTSFMKKCQTDAQKSCDQQAADKKLAGAAKTSFTNKCVKDAVGS